MKHLLYIWLFALPLSAHAQYTDVINSNRPGLSVSAYAVGKNVIQLEAGVFYEQNDHSLLNTESNIWGYRYFFALWATFRIFRIELRGQLSKPEYYLPQSEHFGKFDRFLQKPGRTQILGLRPL